MIKSSSSSSKPYWIYENVSILGVDVGYNKSMVIHYDHLLYIFY
ncbi:hypothetical protein DERF_008564 [Dermatophagoides farinae]|uniref:Uncharacterized protein n=1 Tax=Dermatophagoides farinae TaxID=6954 RepID=A0A922I4Q8_DERFA|nr:hypothetical protein DERF_008564 [Dermatophagoides farinae]